MENSREFFSPHHRDITLILMCGVHNYTKDLTAQNLNTIVMKGVEKSKDDTIIDYQFDAQLGKPHCTVIQFFNVSYVNISTLTMRCPSIKLKQGLITIDSCNIYGYAGTKESLSSISITGRGSRAILDNCTFKENNFVISNFSDEITVSNSTFQSYRHLNSIFTVFSSVVTLKGHVNFTNNIKYTDTEVGGTAIFLLKSLLNITTGATIHFVNLTCNGTGGAIYSENGAINIGAKAKVVFMHNEATSGGALYLYNEVNFDGIESKFNMNILVCAYDEGAIWTSSTMQLNIDTDASLRFSQNTANDAGGAIVLQNGEFIVCANASVTFINNSAIAGGAVCLVNSTMCIYSDAIDFFLNRAGASGGAMFFIFGTMYIKSDKSVKLIANNAQIQGGAIHIERGLPSSIRIDKYAKLLLLNNSAFQGGALYIKPSSFSIQAGYQSTLHFINNTALHVGGAVYSEMQSAAPCLFMVTDYSAEISFKGNYANGSIGHHMYGTSVRNRKCDKEHLEFYYKQAKPYCWIQTEIADGHMNISFDPGVNKTLSPVSSAPQRVCLCDSNDKPQCANFSLIFTNINVYRGETFAFPACIVGYNFGTTVGTAHARFLYSHPFTHLEKSQYNQLINKTEACATLKYTVCTTCGSEILLLQTSMLPVPVSTNEAANKTTLSRKKKRISQFIADYLSYDDGCISESLLDTPVFINITILPGCPRGLTLNHDHTECACYPALAINGFKCSIVNKTGYLEWNSTAWVNTTFNGSHSTGVIFNSLCPLFYCKSGQKIITIAIDPSKQCDSNRTGILCGACMESYSLAIGSSRCIKCTNNYNVALLLAFAAIGVILVFFILALNFTVTQGYMNGLIFYANIVWAYKSILFTSEIQGNYVFMVLKVFIAWLNLDLGFETCFIIGLNPYWKTWLQFLFPFYIWAIAGIIIVACRYSSRLTNLIGSRAVPLLATLFFVSYMKLLRIVIDATSVAVIEHYPLNTSYAVWYLDGNLRYCHYPHIYLYLTAIATFVFLWLPYTLLLLFIQPLRRMSHLRPLKWINKFTPVYDAYLSPLKNKHQYWFGITLLVRGVLLIILTVTSIANPKINILILLVTMTLLLVILSAKNVYKQMRIRSFESAILLNLIIWSAGTLYKWESTKSKMILLMASLGITFAQFCVVLVCSLIKPCFHACQLCIRQKSSYKYHIIDNDITHEQIEDPDVQVTI